jgi:Zn-dependent membrane protease YugP
MEVISMFPFFFDSTFLLLLPALFLAIWAQMKVKGACHRYSQVASRRNLTAGQVARILLDRFGLSGVPVGMVPGELTDHYDPRAKSLSLSQSVYNSTSIAAIGVAAHEVGHAVQDLKAYAPLRLRNAIVPVANIGSGLAFPLFFIGLIMRAPALMNVGILVFLGVVVFHLVTLPVEFDASSKALRLLSETQILAPDEIGGARAVLNAAALTYVAATVMAAAQLLRLVLLRGMVGGRDD